MSVWPASLNQIPLSGWSETPEPQFIEMRTATGPPKRRRRSTYETITRQLELEMDGTQYGTFRTFFNTTLQGGTLTFTWTNGDPRDGTTVTYRFLRPPTVRHILSAPLVADRRYHCILDLEVIQ